jgi:folylpolyglutamate synthase/dihydropteroate synthase
MQKVPNHYFSPQFKDDTIVTYVDASHNHSAFEASLEYLEFQEPQIDEIHVLLAFSGTKDIGKLLI